MNEMNSKCFICLFPYDLVLTVFRVIFAIKLWIFNGKKENGMRKFITAVFMLALVACGSENKNMVVMETSEGDMKIRLYEETPRHRENFVKLVEEGYYEGLLFHRVINHFMIQGGDPDSREAEPGQLLGEGGLGYDVPAEFCPAYFHKKGVLAAAREGDIVNPERASSGSQFYLVQGRVYTPEELDKLVARVNEGRKLALYERLKRGYAEAWRKLEEAENLRGLDSLSEVLTRECDRRFEAERLVLTPAQREAYTTVGGTPHLDGQYTVFGEIVEGLEVLERIAAVSTDTNDRPLKDVVIEKVYFVEK